MAYTVLDAADLDWQPRCDDSGRTIAGLSHAHPLPCELLAPARRTWPAASRPDPGRGLVVLEGTLTVDLGDPPERHELERGSVLVVQPGTILQLRNRGGQDLLLFIYGAPPERTDAAETFEDVPD